MEPIDDQDLGLFHDGSVRDYAEEEEKPETKKVQSKTYAPNDFVRYREVRDRWMENFSHLQRPPDLSAAQDKVGWMVELTELKTNELVRYGITHDWCKRHNLPHLIDLAAEKLEMFSAFPELVKWAQKKLSAIADTKIKTYLPSGQKKKLTKEAVRMIAITSGVCVTERRLSWWARQELFSSPGHDTIETISGRLDFDVSAVLDIVAKNYLKQLNSSPTLTLPCRPEGGVYESREEEIAVARGLEELRKIDLTSVELRRSEVQVRESDFKTIPAFRGLSSAQIEQKIRKVKRVVVEYKTENIMMDYENGDRKLNSSWNDVLCHIREDRAETRKKGRGRWKKEETVWTFSCASPILLGMLSELKEGNISLLPEDLYNLSGRTQELLRSLFWSKFNPIHFALQQARNRLGWKTPKSPAHITQQITYIKQSLDEARNRGYVKPANDTGNWTRGRGEETVFDVKKLHPQSYLLLRKR
jgi:hypothetical protein